MNATATQAAPAAIAARFVDNRDGTITVPALSLMFTQATLCEEEVDQEEARKLCTDCTAGGHTDWRLPTVQELFTLVDHGRYDPSIDTDVFPDTKADWYWTDTPCAWSSARAWCVDFDGGGVYLNHRDSYLAFARAVRAVPAGQ
jgi:hypothetical protein